MEPTQILNICNSFNKNIKFTLEMPTNNAIPFLDTVVYQEQGSFQYHLHVKPTHSNTCLPFSSFVPNSRKRNLVLSETRRALKRSSNAQNNKKSFKIISDRLKANGYTDKFITQHSYNPDTTTDDQIEDEFVSYIKVPFHSERQRREIKKLSQRTKLRDKIRIVFTTAKPLSMTFRKPASNPECPPNCLTCHTAEKPGHCFNKFIIYIISCKQCNKVYVGQTKRCARTRIKEDMTNRPEHVIQHSLQHNQNSLDLFKWRILATVKDLQARLATEALYIRKHQWLLWEGFACFYMN